MGRTPEILLAVGVFVLCWQWLWSHVAVHVQPSRIPGHSRRRVQWLMSNSTRIQVAAAGVIVVASLMPLFR